MERYRIFLKNGNYEVGVGNNRYQALSYALAQGRFKREDAIGISRVSGRGNQTTFKL